MLVRAEVFFKWLAYAAATLALMLLQGVLQDLRFFGVMPFLYPAMAAAAAMLEGPFAGTVYALSLGVVCDLTLVGPLPCFYTLIFTLVGLLSGLVAENWLPADFLCALLMSVTAFVLTDGFHFLLLGLSGRGFAAAALSVAVRETCVTLVFLPAVYLLFRAVHRRCRLDD